MIDEYNLKCVYCDDLGFYYSYDVWEQRCDCFKGKEALGNSEWELVKEAK